MEILSSWIFWVILASIVFVLALIGYLTESMKKSKKDEKKDTDVKDVNEVNNNVTPASEEQVVTEVKADDWMTMPEVSKPLEEVKVDSINDIPSESTVTADVNTETTTGGADLFANANVNETVTPVENTMTSANNNEVNNLNVEPTMNTVGNTVEPTVNTVENTVTPESVVAQESSEPVVSPEVTSSEPVQSTPVETLNTSESDDKNTDIWNL